MTELRRHVVDRTPPADPRVKALAARWDAIGTAFGSGDGRANAQIRAALNTMWRDNRAELSAQVGRDVGWEPNAVAEVIDYLQQVRQAHPDAATDPSTRRDTA